MVVVGSAGATGEIAEYPAVNPSSITNGPDGRVWFTSHDQQIGAAATDGTVTYYPVPPAVATASQGGIRNGPDGNIWVSMQLGDGAKLLRSTPTGTMTVFPQAGSSGGLAVGADGNLWLTESAANTIAKISTAGTVLATYSLPTGNAYPHGPNLGPDGNVWFVEMQTSKIGRITPSGVVTEWPLPLANSSPRVIAAGPDGAMWVTEFNRGKVARFDLTTLTFREYTVGLQPTGITAGMDDAMWVTLQGASQIARVAMNGTVTRYSTPTPAAGPNKITSRRRWPALVQQRKNRSNRGYHATTDA